MNWDHLRYFILVATLGSVSKAAQAAGVSHATVLRAISRLESNLQLRLFDHARSGYQMTADGEDVLENVRTIQTEIQNISQKAKRRDSQVQGKITLSLPDAGTIDLLPQLTQFRAAHPEVTLATQASLLASPEAFVGTGLDIGFAITNSPPEQCVGRKLADTSFVVAGAKSAKLDKATLAQAHWLTWGAGELLQMQREVLRQVGVEQPILHTHSHQFAVDAVSQGLGLSVISKTAVGERLETITQVRTPVVVGLWVLTHPDFRHIPRISAFMRFMSDAFAQHTP
ncbi:MAG: DNA-binding transcriptional LysR family regulator [Candidatus Pseudothioglobus sp.]|jgi:DNA-binding transcriptional LysR family regulator